MSYQLANNLFYVGMSANEKKNFLSYAAAQLDFSSEDIHTKQFKYGSKGWVGRKIAAIPSALICGVVKTIYHLMKAFLISLPKTICSNKPYFKKEIFYAVRNLHEAYGRFMCLFNDHQGLFHVHKSQLHKIAYHQFFLEKEFLSQPTNPSANPKSQDTSQIPSSYPSLLDDETLHSDLLKQLPNNFIKKIESSKEYSLTEKQLLKSAALKIYTSDDKVIQPTDLTYQHMTNRNLIGLKSKYPHFYIIDSMNQWADHDLPHSISNFLTNLDKTAPYEIYGQLVQVNGNHRTACVIDRVNGTVEYYNSFDSDQNVKDNLTELAKKLTEKFGKKFTYSFRTQGLQLQTDGYQCGNWAAKFIEERIKLGKSFNPKNLKNYPTFRGSPVALTII